MWCSFGALPGLLYLGVRTPGHADITRNCETPPTRILATRADGICLPAGRRSRYPHPRSKISRVRPWRRAVIRVLPGRRLLIRTRDEPSNAIRDRRRMADDEPVPRVDRCHGQIADPVAEVALQRRAHVPIASRHDDLHRNVEWRRSAGARVTDQVDAVELESVPDVGARHVCAEP